MKVIIHLMRPLHTYRVRQICVDTTHPGGNRPYTIRIKMHNLAESMHASISSTSSMHSHIMLCNTANGQFKRILNATRRWLALPATKAKTIISYAKCNSHVNTLNIASTSTLTMIVIINNLSISLKGGDCKTITFCFGKFSADKCSLSKL